MPPSNTALDLYDAVEGLSGSAFNDILAGSDETAATFALQGFLGSTLDAEGIALVSGLQAVVGTGVTSFNGGDIILGGAGSDLITGRGGDDIIDGDRWMDVNIVVRTSVGPNGGTGAILQTHKSMTTLVAQMFAGTINPGQLDILREIKTASGVGDIDTAVFSDLFANYDIIYNPSGTVTVAHARGTQTDGTDTLRHVERMQFSDQTITLPIFGTEGDDILNGTEGADTIFGLAGNDTLNGLGGNDVLNGGAGNDTLDGGLGNDTMLGGTGDDTYLAVEAGDTVIEAAGEGTDTVQTALAAYTLGANVENLTFTNAVAHTGNGNALDNVITGAGAVDTLNGNDGNDTLNGGAGNDVLNGGVGNDTLIGGTGSDTMNGGTGDDTYEVATGDTLVEAAVGGGTDTVRTAINNYTLGANLENLTFIGTTNFVGTGNALDNVITGGAFNDTLNGGIGNDTLIGAAGNDNLNGGAGDDTMAGGAGNDVYEVAQAGDVVTEAAGAGTDRVSSFLNSYTLGTNVENLTFVGAGAFAGTGNGLNNIITGGAGDDTLDGAAGNDTLNGGAGNDTLIGGLGNDIMVGGLGDDTYQVAAGDTVTEAAAGGTDIVLASQASYTLGANVENLSYTGAGNFTGTGNGLDNSITGGSGNDTLNGGLGNDRLTGGSGNDTMNGGASNDIFAFSAGFGIDLINGFDADPTDGQDLLDISALGITAGTFGAQVTIVDTGANTLLSFSGGTVVLVGVGDATTITAGDFLLA